MYRFFVLILCLFFVNKPANALGFERYSTQCDTLIHLFLPGVTVYAYPKGSKGYYRYQKRNARLEYNVRKVYPYAQMTAHKINEIERKINNINRNKNKSLYLQHEYQQLMKDFKAPLSKLSITQGKILIRLIYRETNNSAFHHIAHYKGTVNAYFWQTLALLFGNNLKAAYNPKVGEDREIELIVQKIQQGC